MVLFIFQYILQLSAAFFFSSRDQGKEEKKEFAFVELELFYVCTLSNGSGKDLCSPFRQLNLNWIENLGNERENENG
jgi:hypothetical protein